MIEKELSWQKEYYNKKNQNQYPLIGILIYKNTNPNLKHKYITSLDRNLFIEQGGGKVVPIFQDCSITTLMKKLEIVSGVQIPNFSDGLIDANKGLSVVSKTIFRILEYSVKLKNNNQDFPVFANGKGAKAILYYNCQIAKIPQKECLQTKTLQIERLNLHYSNHTQFNQDQTLFSRYQFEKLKNSSKNGILQRRSANVVLKSVSSKSWFQPNQNVLSYSKGTIASMRTEINTADMNQTQDFISAVQHKKQAWYLIDFTDEQTLDELDSKGLQTEQIKLKELVQGLSLAFVTKCRIGNPHRVMIAKSYPIVIYNAKSIYDAKIGIRYYVFDELDTNKINFE